MNQFISLEQAQTMTSRYRQNRESVIDPAFKGQNIIALSETFDRVVFDTLLAKEGCASIRIYYGMDESLKVHAILVPVDNTNNDILPVAARLSLNDTGDLGEQGRRCPEDCPPPSPLNE